MDYYQKQRRTASEYEDQVRCPRICMPTARAFKKKVFYCGHYEAQDVLADVEDLDLICLEPGRGYEARELWQRRLMYRDISGRIAYINPGLRKVRLTREYDLFLARCQTYKDLLDVNAVEGWKDLCKISVCWLDELFAASIPELKYSLDPLRHFDYVFTCCNGTVAALAELIRRPVYWLPGAVDTLRFTAGEDPSRRVIDVYSIGRRWTGIHESLLRAARSNQIFYVYDTSAGSQANVYDHRQHRDYLASMAKRSRYFMVAPGKIDSAAETQGQLEVGHRYFEGAAAGAVMIGQKPAREAFRQLFPWHDAVIEIDPDGSNVLDVIRRLDLQPQLLARLSQRNTVEALRRHDWVYRWKEIYRVAGLQLSPGMIERERLLNELAAAIPESLETGLFPELTL